MQALIEVVLPVFIVMGFGYVARWRTLLTDGATDALTGFAQNFAIPCLLFLAISNLELGAEFDPALLGSFYLGAVSGFVVGITGARLLFKRPWDDSVVIGFSCLFSNSILLGLPITERAYGADALGPNFAIVAIHAPFCYVIGLSTMEILRGRGSGIGFGATAAKIGRSVFANPLLIGIALGFAANFIGFTAPETLNAALEMMRRAALPVALFGLGAVLYRYRPEGDLRVVSMICVISLGLHPAIAWTMGQIVGLSDGQLKSAVLTASMAPGVNTYIFANLYGVAKRVAASAVLIATALSVGTIWLWLQVLG